jgi:RNA polymerase sigma factor (sigma-70 family)
LTLAGSSTPTAEDIAQEAFARTFRHWRRVRHGTNPPGYLYRVAFRLLHKRGLLPTTALDETTLPVSGPEDTAVVQADLERVLRAMPPRRRACAVLCFALGLTPTDAAEALRIAPGTVRKQLELARTTLRSGLGEETGPLTLPTRPTAAGS